MQLLQFLCLTLQLNIIVSVQTISHQLCLCCSAVSGVQLHMFVSRCKSLQNLSWTWGAIEWGQWRTTSLFDFVAVNVALYEH